MSAANITSAATVSPVNYDVEYLADAWYSVCALFDGEKLTVKYHNFTDDDDSVFRPQDFKSLQELEDFKGRFRPLSTQLQDNECKSIAEGMVVCASRSLTPSDVRFYDAFVDEVIEKVHCFTNGEEQCKCNFMVIWQHGPIAGCLAVKKIEDICRPQSNFRINPNVASFLKLVEKKLGTAAHQPHLISSLPMKPRSTFSPKGTNYARLPVTSKWKSQEMERMYNSSERNSENTDLGAFNRCFVIGNLDKDLHPSAIVEFIHCQTSVSVQAYIFPSFPSETYTKGVIRLDCQKDFQKLYEFLDSPNHIIVSWRGRPWVTKISREEVALGSLMSKYKLEDKSIGKGKGKGGIKVVHCGCEKYEIAKQLRDMYMEFVEHQERLHTTLALKEKEYGLCCNGSQRC
ncbi:uncharacterized protein [Euphorbia lathyris]|uniref:uncharacterized protein n=1 Tax=Euphorbia lathyris TaxID=212925 RepID=UPI0033141BEA